MLRSFTPRRWGEPPGATHVTVDGVALAFRRVDAPGAPLPGLLARQRLVVGLHGLGANETQMTTLIPLAVDGAYLALRAPHPRGREGYSWFAPALPQRPDTVADALAPVRSFVRWAQERTGAAPDQTALVGYSQAAAVVAALGTVSPTLADHVVLASAALPRVLDALPGTGPCRAFIGVGLRDPLVDPLALADLRARWRAAGTDLTSVDYDSGHVVSPDETADIAAWIAAR